MQYQRVSSLSGGERRRLHLLRILMAAPNVLILDEPTNDLDLETLNVLEDYLESFQGAVIAVSHDRYFLDRVTTHLFAFEKGHMAPYINGYQSYLDAHEDDAADREVKPEKTPAPKRSSGHSAPRFSFKEQRDFETIDGTIAELEEKLTSLTADIERYAADYSRVMELMEQQTQAQQQLDEAMERWMYLQEKYEQIQNYAKEKNG